MSKKGFMDKKKYLSRYKHIIKRVQQLEDALFEIDGRLLAIQGQVITDMPKGGIPATFDDLLVEKEDLQERINRLLVLARAARREICLCLDSLADPVQADILERYFIGGSFLEDIADTIGYSLSGIKKIYQAGMREVVIGLPKQPKS